MTNNEEYNLFVDNLLENANSKFRETAQCRLIQEKLGRMEQDCDTMFAPPEREFAGECFCLLSEAAGEREAYLYRQGMLNCIDILKCMGVLR